MEQKNSILELARKNNGMISTAMVVKKGFARGSLKYLVDTGCLEKVDRGVYCLPDEWEDEFFSLQARYKKGIFSLDTALFLADLTDRTPAQFNMPFPTGYNISKLKGEGILANTVKSTLHNLGIENKITPSGHTVKAYNPERCLCDIVKEKNHCDIQLISEAFKNYVKWNNRDINKLSKYADILKVGGKIRTYLEVLLWQI